MKKINPTEITDNFVRSIGDEWMLLTAGNKESFNTMTAAWGTIGVLWSVPVAIVFIRPTRYTYEFFENNDFFSICFFEEKYRELLNFCGTHSGKDVDKIKATGLNPDFYESKTIIFSQARLSLICKKLYHDDLKPHFFLDEKIEKKYPLKDYHRFYIGEIVDCLYNDTQ